MKLVLGLIGLFVSWFLANNGLEALREANINGEMYQRNEVVTMIALGATFLLVAVAIFFWSIYAIVSKLCSRWR